MPTTYVNFMCSNKKHAEEIKGSLFSYYANPTVLFKNFTEDGSAFQFILDVPEEIDPSWKDSLEYIINKYRLEYRCLARIIYKDEKVRGWQSDDVQETTNVKS